MAIKVLAWLQISRQLTRSRRAVGHRLHSSSVTAHLGTGTSTTHPSKYLPVSKATGCSRWRRRWNQYADTSGSDPHREGPSGAWADGYRQTLIRRQEQRKERKMRAVCCHDGTITRTLGPLCLHHSTHNNEDWSVLESRRTRLEPSPGQWS